MLSYPTKYEDANLNIIKTLRRIFPNVKVGYSDHTIPDKNGLVLSTAYLFGAEVIEKHFTLDKNLKGNDHYHSGDPEDFKAIIDNFKLIEIICGQEEKKVLDCEVISRREARRSLVITRDMKKGEIIREKDIIFKRPGTGIKPECLDIVLGRSVNQDLKEDTVLTWNMI